MISDEERKRRERYAAAQAQALNLISAQTAPLGRELTRLMEEMMAFDRWLAANIVSGEGQPPARKRSRPFNPAYQEIITLRVRKLTTRELER